MPKDKVEKLSISIPASQAAHVKNSILEDNLKGVSDYFQRLIAEDIERATRKLAKSQNVQAGIRDHQLGNTIDLDPKTIDLIVQRTLERLQETSGDGKRNTDIHSKADRTVRKANKR